MIILTIVLAAAAFGVGVYCSRRRYGRELQAMRLEMDSLRDPELLRAAALRRQMQQDQKAFHLLCNYGTELAYGQVSAADMMEKEETDDR